MIVCLDVNVGSKMLSRLSNTSWLSNNMPWTIRGQETRVGKHPILAVKTKDGAKTGTKGLEVTQRSDVVEPLLQDGAIVATELKLQNGEEDLMELGLFVTLVDYTMRN
jgi:hypothetical protein